MGGVSKSMGKGNMSQAGGTDLAPWGPQAERLQKGFAEANRLYDKPLQYFEGGQADFTPYQRMAQDMTTQRAYGRMADLQGAQRDTMDIIGGKYTDVNNPYFQGQFNRAVENTMPQINASAIMAGRGGSGAQYRLQNKAASQIATDTMMPFRQIQEAAKQEAIPLAREDYNTYGKLAAVGQEQQAMEQARIDQEMAKHNFDQMENWNRLTMFLNAVTGDYGSGTTANTTRRGK